MLPSSVLPFLNVSTDGKAKDRHNEEVLFFSRLLRAAGVRELCLHHIDEAGMNRDLPLTLAGKWYDLVYVSQDGEVFLIEVMRARKIYTPGDDKQVRKWRKEEQNSPLIP